MTALDWFLLVMNVFQLLLVIVGLIGVIYCVRFVRKAMEAQQEFVEMSKRLTMEARRMKAVREEWVREHTTP